MSDQAHITDTIQKKFKTGFRWNLFGSIAYETIKTIHHLFLLQLLDVSIYGLMGSTLALIYFSTKLADVGSTFSLPPFFHLFQKSKKNFRTLLFKFFLLPQFPIIIGTAALVTYFHRQTFTACPSLYVLLPSVIILETLRSFLRYFLHFSFKSQIVVKIELASFVGYLGAIWFAILALKVPFNLTVIFLPHLLDSAFVVATFCYLMLRVYRRLPGNNALIPAGTHRKILNLRVFNYLLRISRDLFTRNFLTPLFAYKFGLQQAGFFFLAGTIGTSIQQIIKAAIGYSGNALFANIKENTQEVKKQAFGMLCEKLMKIVAPIIIFLLFNYRFILKLGNNQDPTLFTLGLLLLFLIVILSEFFLLLYEQFYIIEESSRRLFYFKIIELCLLYSVISSRLSSTPVSMLTNLVIIRLVSCIIIGTNAYSLWRIKPKLKTRISYLFGCIAISLLFMFLY